MSSTGAVLQSLPTWDSSVLLEVFPSSADVSLDDLLVSTWMTS